MLRSTAFHFGERLLDAKPIFDSLGQSSQPIIVMSSEGAFKVGHNVEWVTVADDSTGIIGDLYESNVCVVRRAGCQENVNANDVRFLELYINFLFRVSR